MSCGRNCVRNPAVPRAPSARRARATALRAIAVSTQRVVGCTQAPRPGSVAETSTTASPSRATTLTRRDLSARSRQPRQVLTEFILSPSSLPCRCTPVLEPLSLGASLPSCSTRRPSRAAARASADHPGRHASPGRPQRPGIASRGIRRRVRRVCSVLVEDRVGLDVDAGAGELGREAGVLTLLADGE